MRSSEGCPVCEGSDAEVFFERTGVLAVTNVLYSTRQAALAAPRGDLRLAFCRHCTHIFNAAFEPERARYVRGYENALHFSETFGRFQRELAERLIATFDLRGKNLVEIGCGDGTFLRLLCELSDSRGIGIDPLAHDDGRDERVRLVAAVEPSAMATTPDFVCSRHTLEHVGQPRTLLAWLTAGHGETRPGIYFEAPDGTAPFCAGAIWDLVYEHCSYFTPESLACLCEHAGISIRAVTRSFGGQYLSIEGWLGDSTGQGERLANPAGLSEALSRFPRIFEERIRLARQLVRCAAGPVVVWGAGSKGISFLDAIAGAGIGAAVDINPRKHGRWIGGAAIEIVGLPALRTIRPATVVLLNPIYQDEVRRALEVLGVEAEVMVA